MNMTSLRIGVLGAATVLCCGLAGPAFADTAGTAHPAGWGYGYNNVIHSHAAAAWKMSIEGGTTVDVFCVDEAATYDSNPSTAYTPTVWSGSGRPNLAKAADIAVNGQSKGTPLADKNAEYAARQLAIWKLTNDLDYSTVNNAAIRDRATALVAAATSHAERPSSAALTMRVVQDAGKDHLTAHLSTAAGVALSGQYVTLVTTDGVRTVQTDASGNAGLVVDAPDKTSMVVARWKGVLPSGTVLVPAAASSQKVITTTDAEITRTVSATLPGTTVTPAPVVTVQPNPTSTVSPPAPTGPSTTIKPTLEPTATARPSTPASTTPGSHDVITPGKTPGRTPDAPVHEPKELPYTGTWLTGGVLSAMAAAVVVGFWLRRRSAT